MWKLIGLSVVMLVTGYWGEAELVTQAVWGDNLWFSLFCNRLRNMVRWMRKLAKEAGGDVLHAHKILCWFVLVGWAIYPVGYMAGTAGWY